MVNGDQISPGSSQPIGERTVWDPQGQEDPESPLVLMTPPESADSEIPAEQI